MKKRDFLDTPCAVARALTVVGDGWALMIIRSALMGTRRFGDFQRKLGVAKNILADRLKLLVDEGILEIQPASDGSAYSEYLPTRKGRDLLPVIVALAQWGSQYLFKKGERCVVPRDSETKLPLRKLRLEAKDGRELAEFEGVLLTPAK